MFTAITNTEASRLAEIMVANGGLAKPSKEKQIELDWEMAHKLDAAGDRYKAEGKLELAKVCYSRALARAIKASK
jgi:hypothetical protein